MPTDICQIKLSILLTKRPPLPKSKRQTPSTLDELKRQITRIDIELAALKREENAKEKQDKLKAERDNLQKQFDFILTTSGNNKKKLLLKLQDARIRLEKKKIDLEGYSERLDAERSSANQIWGIFLKIAKEIAELQKLWEAIPEADKVLREQVTDMLRIL